jgi:probable phosphoglycerate mutase
MLGPMAKRYPQRRFALPPDATEVILVRHGASESVARGEPLALLGGHADPALAPEGEEQARLVGERLRREPVHALFVTPLRRTHQTAAPLAARLGLEPRVVEDLREVHLGEWEGGELRIRMAEGDPTAMRVLEEERWDSIPGAEDATAFAERVRRGLEHVIAETGPGRVSVAVSHGGVIGELCRQATASRPFAFVHNENTSVTRLVAFPTGHRLLRSFNDTTHLDAAGA